MIAPGTRILLVEDNPGDRRLVEVFLRGRPEVTLTAAATVAAAVERLEAEGWDLVLLDLTLPDSAGIETFETVREAAGPVPIIPITGTDSDDLARDLVRRGAQDYLVKGSFDALLLQRSIGYAIERARIQSALRRSEADHRALFEHASHGIYRATPDGVFVRVNPSLVRMLGYDRADDLVGTDVCRRLYVDPEARESLAAQAARTGRIDTTEVGWRRRDGREIRVSLTGRAVLDDAGRTVGFEMFAEDVTERRALEDRLRQAQKMEAMARLSAGIAHELNTILTVVMTEADLIGARLEAHQADVRADLDDLKETARRGARVIKRLIGFSRRERLSLRPLDLNDLVLDLREPLSHTLPEPVRLTVLPGDVPATVEADPRAVEEVLFALVSNSRDALAGSSGKVEIAVRRARLDDDYCRSNDGAVPGDYVRISVRDDGTGMTPEVRSRVFEPFFTTRGRGLGDGLGMPMAYGLVKQHGGYIEVRSEAGKGTTVHVYLPFREGAPATATEAAEPGSREEGATVLVVDDDSGVRMAAQRALSRFGYEVLTADNGAEALATYREHGEAIDLIFTDVVMPVMSGDELWRRIREEGGSVRILFTSGYSGTDFDSGVLLDPDLPMLPKPWSVDELLAAVRRSLSSDTEPALAGA